MRRRTNITVLSLALVATTWCLLVQQHVLATHTPALAALLANAEEQDTDSPTDANSNVGSNANANQQQPQQQQATPSQDDDDYDIASPSSPALPPLDESDDDQAAASPSSSADVIAAEIKSLSINSEVVDDRTRDELSSFLAEAARFASKASKACAAVVAANCDPCFGSSGSSCDAWKDECDKLMCNPLCLRLTWDVDVTPIGGSPQFKEELSKKAVQYAVGAQLRAHACSNMIGCCEENESLEDWVELRVFGGYFPDPLSPIEACKDGDRKKLCSMCKSGVKVVVKLKPASACDYFTEVPPPPPSVAPVFSRNYEAAAMQVPKHGSFKKRCKELQAVIGGQIGAMQSKFQANICGILGCCDQNVDEFFPVAYKTAAEAVADNKK